MIYTKAIVQSILSTHLLVGGEGIYQNEKRCCSLEVLVDHIVTELNEMGDTQGRLKLVRDEEIEAKNECEETLQALADERGELQVACNHHSESKEICDICGSQLF